jgi:hypothetical protein
MICAGRRGGNQDTCQVKRVKSLINEFILNSFLSENRVIQAVHFHGKAQPMVYGMLSVLQVGVMVVVILEFTHVLLRTHVIYYCFCSISVVLNF